MDLRHAIKTQNCECLVTTLGQYYTGSLFGVDAVAKNTAIFCFPFNGLGTLLFLAYALNPLFTALTKTEHPKRMPVPSEHRERGISPGFVHPFLPILEPAKSSQLHKADITMPGKEEPRGVASNRLGG
jgi:hypothetical protein